MHHAVFEFGKLRAVPAVGSSDKVAGDSLELVNLLASAVRADFHFCVRILEPAVKAAVAVVVDRAVSDVVFVHQVHDGHDCFGIVGCITVNLNVEDVSAAGEVVVRSFDFSLVLRGTFVIDRYMVGIGLVILVGNARDDTEFLLV